jgi:hypothetical protein
MNMDGLAVPAQRRKSFFPDTLHIQRQNTGKETFHDIFLHFSIYAVWKRVGSE